MSNSICTICGNRFNIMSGRPDTDLICSIKCFVKLLLKYKSYEGDVLGSIEKYKIDYSSTIVDDYKSHYERVVTKFFLLYKVKFEYEKYGFKLVSSLQKSTYTPDFFLPKFNCFVEVKGLWHVGSYDKIKKFREVYKIPLIILQGYLYKNFLQYDKIKGVL